MAFYFFQIIFHEQKAEKSMKSVKVCRIINFSLLNKCHCMLYCFFFYFGRKNTWKITISMLSTFYQSYLFSKYFSWFFTRIKFPEKEILLIDNNRLYLVVKDQNPWNLQNITCMKSNSLEVYYIEHICWCQFWKMLIWIILGKSEVKDFLKNVPNVGNILSNLVFQPFKNCKIFLN